MKNSLLPAHRQARLSEALVIAASIPGIALEVGVFQGGSLAMVAAALPGKRIYGFDTFEGLPKEHWRDGEIHLPGDFTESEAAVADFLAAQGARNVELVKGIFPQSAARFDLRAICFAHVDVDFYEGTKQSLEWIWPRMSIGGIVIVDDYLTASCPGVKRAIDELFLAQRGTIRFEQCAEGQAWLTKI